MQQFFPLTVNIRHNSYKEHQDNFNICDNSKEQYEKLRESAISISYKKVSKKTQDQINNQGEKILNIKEVTKIIFVNGT